MIRAGDMRRHFTWVICALAAALICAAGSLRAQQPPSARGEAIAQKQCARCHAIGVTGASPMGLAPPFRDLPRRYPVDHLAEALAEGIIAGHPAMPEFTFEPPEIEALLSYIAGLAPPGPPAKR